MAAVKDWTFEGTWPYEPKWFDSPDGRMHYVDEGPRDGRPVVMVHGNPTWGYLYRNFIGPLVEAGHRAIVPDHLGFGRSEKPRDPELYRVPRHAERLDALLESLDLRGATVVPQDWGGPTGLYWATRHPERVDGLFILNTYAHGFRREALPPGKDKIPLPLPLRLFRMPVIGEVLVKGLDAFKRGFLFGQGTQHHDRLTPTVKRAYREVHGGWADRTPILVFPREIPVDGEGPVVAMTTEIEERMKQHFRSKPVHVTWAMKDPAFLPAYLDALWLDTFPDASVTRLEDAGHYLQEDAHERIVPELVSFVGGFSGKAYLVPRLPEREPVPDDVEITSTPRTPVWDSTVGIDVPLAPRGTPRNRLVTIGDSLTHGFQSGAIFNTDLSYPAIIATELGWYKHFRHPHYPALGGIPLNLELLIHELERHFGDRISWWEFPEALYRIRQHLAESEHWWDHGPGAEPPKEKEINHNLGIYGWDLRDALSRTADTAAAEWRVPDHWRLIPLIRNADAIAAIRVLHSARDGSGKGLTPFGAAAALGAEGVKEGPDDNGDRGDGIETLIVELGANNALGSVISLKVRWSGDGYDNLRDKAKYNVWRPTHFKAELDHVAAAVRKIRARHVIWSTVPHITIAPVARGVKGKVQKGSRYFKYYTRPWIRDRDFDPDEDHPYLTAEDARAIDSAIDQYNDSIVAMVKAARKEGRDWRLLDLAGFLDRLASRRYIDDPDKEPPDWWTPYALPPELQHLQPIPDSRFFASGPDGRTAGGLFSLDGIHATTIAYGLMAQEFINVMADAGVTFYNRAGAARTPPINVGFKDLIPLDTLISHPPRSLGSDVSLIGWLDQRIDVFSRLWAGIG